MADSIEELEAKTILEGVKLAGLNKWQHVYVESDAATVIKHLKCSEFSWRIETIVSNAKAMASDINRVSWANIPKSANQSADWLAKHAMQGLCPSD